MPVTKPAGRAFHAIPQSSTWSESGSSGANAALSLVHAAEAGNTHHITAVSVVLRGAAATVDTLIEVKSATNVLWREYLGAAAVVGTRIPLTFPLPLSANVGEQVEIAVAAGGAGAITTANVAGYTTG